MEYERLLYVRGDLFNILINTQWILKYGKSKLRHEKSMTSDDRLTD